MSKPKVAVVVPADLSGDSYRRMEKAGCNVALADASWSKGFNATTEQYLRLCEGADAIIGARLEGVPITRDLLAASPELRIYCRYNIGYDDIDLRAATEQGVLLAAATAHMDVVRDQAVVRLTTNNVHVEASFRILATMLSRAIIPKWVSEGGGNLDTLMSQWV